MATQADLTREQMLQKLDNVTHNRWSFDITFSENEKDTGKRFTLKMAGNDLEVSMAKGSDTVALVRKPGAISKVTEIKLHEVGIELVYEFSHKSIEHHDDHDHILTLIVLYDGITIKNFFYYIREVHKAGGGKNIAGKSNTIKQGEATDQIFTHESGHGGGRG